jgi:Transposase DDE domain
VEQADGLCVDERVAEAQRLLRELIGQDFDIDQDGVPRLHRGTRPGRIVSTVDPEMRHGRKSHYQRFDGYKLSAAVTNTSQPLITAVEVAPASEPDGAQATYLIDTQPATRRPPRVLGDTAYGVGPVRAALAARGVEVLAPVAGAPVAEGRLGIRDFQLDLEAGRAVCPAGHSAAIHTLASGRRQASFARRACGSCSLRNRCLGPRTRHKTLRIAPDEELLASGRRALAAPATADHLRRCRPRIERLLGLLAHRYGARKSRYIGRAKTRLQAAWAAAVVNLNPIARSLASRAS